MKDCPLYHARSLSPWLPKMVLVLLIIVIVSGASLAGHGGAVLIAMIIGVLTTVMQELVRTALRYKSRAT